ncbi:MAG: hypothetical protein ABFC77_04175 [Thermoguttaceae bacterium]
MNRSFLLSWWLSALFCGHGVLALGQVGAPPPSPQLMSSDAAAAPVATSSYTDGAGSLGSSSPASYMDGAMSLGPSTSSLSPSPSIPPTPDSSSGPGLRWSPRVSNLSWTVAADALWLDRSTPRGIALGCACDGWGYATEHLWSDDKLFYLAPGLRLQVTGQVTDQMSIEAVGWGLQNWSIERTLYTDSNWGNIWVYSPWLANDYFDDAIGYRYKSQVANAELNQRFQFLAFEPYRSCSWLWGVRYLHLSDDFSLFGENFDGGYDALDLKTKNNLVGMQLGLQTGFGGERFQLSVEAKVGLYANLYSQKFAEAVGGNLGDAYVDGSHSGTELSALFELSILLRYRIAESLWLRGGYQYCGLTGLALGPRQLNGYDAGGTLDLDGLFVGVEWRR